MAVQGNKLSFTSQYRYEFVAKKGSTGFTIGGSFPTNQPTITIPHNLGYVPFFRLYYTFSSGIYYQLFAGNSSYNIEGNQIQVENIYADTSNVYVAFFNNAATTVGGTIYYRIYGEPQT
jgi:hypothetical protein